MEPNRMARVFTGCMVFCQLLTLAQSNPYRVSDKNKVNATRESVLHKVLSGYDRRLPPGFNEGKATTVDVNIFILSFDSVSELSMDYVVTLYFRQSWLDKRLRYANLLNVTSLELDPGFVASLWVPDLFFHNEKKGYFHQITVPNRLLRVENNGRVIYSVRLTLTLSCPMRLHSFPFDHQRCPLFIESYSFSEQHIKLKWLDPAVSTADNLEVPRFVLKKFELEKDCNIKYSSTGSFACLLVNFLLNRDRGYYIIQVYIPTLLVVMLSWVNFWISMDAVPARISLGVITVLTITTQASNALQALPRVSYVKAIDIWMVVCLAFVFAGLLEFALVNVLSRRRRRIALPVMKKKVESKTTPEDLDPAAVICQKFWAGYGYEWDPIAQFIGVPRAEKEREEGKLQAEKVDKLARLVFPILFLIFNICYWCIYLLMWKD